MSEHDVFQRCRHGNFLPPFQHRLLEGDVLRPLRLSGDLCRECWDEADAQSAVLAARHGVRHADWEGTALRGRVRDIVFSSDIGKFVVLLSPGGFATIAPENVHAFESDGRRLGERIGEWWEIGYAEDGDIWFHRIVRPTFLERLLDRAHTRSWRSHRRRLQNS